jgi:hypothetical protein
VNELPWIDEHSLEIEAPPEEVWAALAETVPRFGRGRAGEALAAALGAEHRRVGGSVPEPGSTIVGFRVARADAPIELALEGRHRFSRYALIFRIDDLGDRSRLRAETRAEFPGPHGRLYRALVIGTRGHMLVVRRILGAVRRRTERSYGSS